MPKIIPFGNRILVRRRKVGEKAGSLYLPDTAKERPTDLADVTFVPDLTFSDKHILDNSEKIVKSLTEKAIKGNSEALKALLEINQFIKIKSIKVGDAVMISKYTGIDFHEKDNPETKTLVDGEDVIGLVVEDE